jgi:hypothetical protein
MLDWLAMPLSNTQVLSLGIATSSGRAYVVQTLNNIKMLAYCNHSIFYIHFLW